MFESLMKTILKNQASVKKIFLNIREPSKKSFQKNFFKKFTTEGP